MTSAGTMADEHEADSNGERDASRIAEAPGCCDAIRTIARFDQHFGCLAEEYRSVIDDGTRGRLSELCSIAALTSLGETEELVAHLRRAKAMGVKPAEALEAILITANYAGLLRLSRAADKFEAVFDEPFPGQHVNDYPEVPNPNGFDQAALAVGESMYGAARAHANFMLFRHWDKSLADVTERVIYGGLDRRNVIAAADREVCSVAVMAVLGAVFPLEWHARVALELGASRHELTAAVVSQLPHVGYPPVVAALQALDGVLDTWNKHIGQVLSWG